MQGDNPLCLNSCKVRPCNIKNNYFTCADCKKFKNLAKCKKYNPFLIKFGEFITKTSREKCIMMIKEIGIKQFINFMIANKLVSYKKLKANKEVK